MATKDQYVVVLRVDEFDDRNEEVTGYDAEDTQEVWGPFDDHDTAYEFVKGCESRLKELNNGSMKTVYGWVSFHICNVMWGHPSYPTDDTNQMVASVYRAVDNWVPTEEDN